jgi:hypothetical protein
MSMNLRALRIAAFIAVALATVAVVASLVPPYLARNNPSADGLQWVAAVFVVPLYVVLVLPAFVLALIGKRIPLIISAVLLGVAYLVAIWILGN